jgi:hypothetical protein
LQIQLNPLRSITCTNSADFRFDPENHLLESEGNPISLTPKAFEILLVKIAQAYALIGDKASALRVLRHSIENEFFPYSYFATDPLLDSLRSEGEFSRLMDAARQRHEGFKSRFF